MNKFIVEGQPMGKARPRFTRNGHTYTPHTTKDYEELIKMRFKAQNKGIEPSLNEISVIIHSYYKIPQSASLTLKYEMLSGKLKPKVKPDIDNVSKIVLDALNGLAYKDDNQVTELHVYKHYALDPCIEVEIIESGNS